MAVRYTFAVGTADEWAASSSVLAMGQPGYDSTTKVLKIGDGQSTWTQLPVAGGIGAFGQYAPSSGGSSGGSGGGGTVVLGNPMTASGDIIVAGAQGLPTRLPGVPIQIRKYLSSLGNGTIPNPPVWSQIQVADVQGANLLQSAYSGVNAQTGTSYTLSLGDAGKLVTMSNAAANTLIVPLNSVVAFPIGTFIDVVQSGAGATSIGYTAGVVVSSVNSVTTLLARYSLVRLIKTATDAWLITGVLASVSTGGGSTGGGQTGGGGSSGVTNLIVASQVQNASAAANFLADAGTVSLDSAVSKSGGSSIKLTPDNSGTYAYLKNNAYSDWAPVTPGQTYCGFASVRMDTNVAEVFQCYLRWMDASGNVLGVASADAQLTGLYQNWVQVKSTAVAPAGASWASVLVEFGGSGAVMVAANTIHIDEIGINQGTSSTWTTGTAGTGGGTSPAPASITDAGFTYGGTGWQSVTTPVSEHYSSTVGNTASVTFTLLSQGTFSLLGQKESSNGTLSISVDGAAAVTVSESQTTPQAQAVVWTSGTLAAGTHTIVVTVASPDGSIQGATITNGSFAAPATGGGGAGQGGTGTSGTNTTINGSIIGGAPSSNASGYNPPTADAFPGYTQILSEDFNTNFVEASGGSDLNAKLPRWNGYQGQPNGNYPGMNWDTSQISATGGVVTMRNTNKGSNCQALTPIMRDAGNVSGTWSQQSTKYGKWILRMKGRGSVGYKIAFLLWPTAPATWDDGEIDFPEGDVISNGAPYTMTGASHNVTGTNSSKAADMKFVDAKTVAGLGTAKGRIDDGLWHTFMIEWDSNRVTMTMDGIVVNNVTDPTYIPTKAMRWELQCEPTRGEENNAAMYIDIDWVAAYKKG